MRVDADAAIAHTHAQQQAGQADRPQAEDHQRVADVRRDFAQRGERSTGGTGQLCRDLEGDIIGQGQAIAGIGQHEVGVRAVLGAAEGTAALVAEGRVTRAAIHAVAAAESVVDADPVAYLRMLDTGTYGCDDAGGLVAGDHAVAALRPFAAAVVFVQVATAKAGDGGLDHDLSGAGLRLGEIANFDPALAEVDDTLHISPPF